MTFIMTFLWFLSKEKLSTSSKFSAVVRRRNTTSCHNMMKEPLNTSGSIYETVSEATDIKLYENLKKVVQCRLFIDPENKFMWPSSDGVLGDEGVTEVKYLQSIKG